MSDATIHQINVSGGGVPKRPVQQASVTTLGLSGDAVAHPGIHGGPDMAVSLFALERIEALSADGHPIAPGSTGENVTTRGLDWDALAPGQCLQLGAEVVLRITGFAAPCRSIKASFSDGRFGRLSQIKAPGWSRLYAEVLREGVIHPGDGITRLDESALVAKAGTGENRMQINYVNVYVSDLERSIEFYEKTLGLTPQFADPKFGYASFEAGPVRLGIAQIDSEDPDGRALCGRQTGVGFAVEDLVARHEELAANGVSFPMPPAKQPWGGFMGMFADPDGNLFYLDQIAEQG